MVETHVMVGGQIFTGVATPKDRTFRAAWKAEEGVIEVDMAAAREIFRDMLRRARKAKLEELDAAARKFRRDEEQLDLIDVEAQRLRDLPADPRIDAASTPEELLALWPSGWER